MKNAFLKFVCVTVLISQSSSLVTAKNFMKRDATTIVKANQAVQAENLLKDTNFADVLKRTYVARNVINKALFGSGGQKLVNDYNAFLQNASSFNDIVSFYSSHNLDTALLVDAHLDEIASYCNLQLNNDEYAGWSSQERTEIVTKAFQMLKDENFVASNPTNASIVMIDEILKGTYLSSIASNGSFKSHSTEEVENLSSLAFTKLRSSISSITETTEEGNEYYIVDYFPKNTISNDKLPFKRVLSRNEAIECLEDACLGAIGAFGGIVGTIVSIASGQGLSTSALKSAIRGAITTGLGGAVGTFVAFTVACILWHAWTDAV